MSISSENLVATIFGISGLLVAVTGVYLAYQTLMKTSPQGRGSLSNVLPLSRDLTETQLLRNKRPTYHQVSSTSMTPQVLPGDVRSSVGSQLELSALKIPQAARHPAALRPAIISAPHTSITNHFNYISRASRLLRASMQIRSASISTSILAAISTDPDNPKRRSFRIKIFRVLASFLSIFSLPLSRYRAADFLELRHNVWQMDEEEYANSFHLAERRSKGKSRESDLKPVGDLGYSGSTFFTTADGKFLIKSLPRRFEHEFFTHDLFDAYVAHMKEHPHSLLVRITDMVYTSLATLGGILGTAPTHHIIMENLLYGKEMEETEHRKSGWETYDLKPNDYFFPERDIAGGKLAPESVKERLIDEFPDKIRMKADKRQELLDLLDADTKLLADNNAVDYSLFLVRYPGPNVTDSDRENAPSIQSDAHPWRTGIVDADGNWFYRVVVLDFFWAKHKFRAKLMTGLVDSYNVIAGHGPMSITANPAEYQQRFIDMVKDIVIEA